jgi:hypothetical protein
MNIFFLHRDPKIAASYLCDKHIVKMAIEYAQLLSFALHLTGSTTNQYTYKLAKKHIKHPCTLWVCESLSHWKWLWLHGHHTGNEYTRRYGKIHKSTRVLRNLPVPNKLVDLGWLRDPPQAIKDYPKMEDTVNAYRNYYCLDKAKFARWGYSKTPDWWPE